MLGAYPQTFTSWVDPSCPVYCDRRLYTQVSGFSVASMQVLTLTSCTSYRYNHWHVVTNIGTSAMMTIFKGSRLWRPLNKHPKPTESFFRGTWASAPLTVSSRIWTTHAWKTPTYHQYTTCYHLGC